MSDKSEAAFETLMQEKSVLGMPQPLPLPQPNGPSEMEVMVKARRHQRFFRNAVLSSYE